LHHRKSFSQVGSVTVEFWFEFASTYSYPAAMRVEAAAVSRGVAFVWKPFLLGPIFAAQGWADSPFNLYPEKGRYMWRDLERLCARYGPPFRRPSHFPRSGLLAARVVLAAEKEPWVPAFIRAVYLANFAEDRNIADRAVIAALLREAGQPDAPLLARADAAVVKERLRAQTEEARLRGIFGAPSMFVGEELFWGDDRLEEALDWALLHHEA
jgi:2-hydroxychromene-2-carboxylate isomerase